jgi:hypothetical protein
VLSISDLPLDLEGASGRQPYLFDFLSPGDVMVVEPFDTEAGLTAPIEGAERTKR